MTEEQIKRLMSATIYSWDVSTRLAGIVDFLDFAERNLSSQRERELKRARAEAEALQFCDEDVHLLAQAQHQIVESAVMRFDVGLARNVRYAGLVAYVTAVEWCMALFSKRMTVPPPKKSPKENRSVHIFGELNRRVAGRLSAEVETFKRIVHVRNCVVHSTGVVEGDDHELEVRAALTALPGLRLSTEGFDGASVHIDAGAIDALAKSALAWVPSLDEECTRNGVFGTAP